MLLVLRERRCFRVENNKNVTAMEDGKEEELTASNMFSCSQCGASGSSPGQITHKPDCPYANGGY